MMRRLRDRGVVVAHHREQADVADEFQPVRNVASTGAFAAQVTGKSWCVPRVGHRHEGTDTVCSAMRPNGGFQRCWWPVGGRRRRSGQSWRHRCWALCTR
jgi:hypothetical protein